MAGIAPLGLGGELQAVLKLREQLMERDELIARLRSEIRELTIDRQQLERVINVLTVEFQNGKIDRSKIVGRPRTKQ